MRLNFLLFQDLKYTIFVFFKFVNCIKNDLVKLSLDIMLKSMEKFYYFMLFK